MSIVETAEEEAARQGSARVGTVFLRLGRLSGVVKEALLSSYELVCEGTSLEGSRLDIEEIPIEIYCRPCGEPRTPKSDFNFHCPVCGGPEIEVRQGKEIEIRALEIES